MNRQPAKPTCGPLSGAPRLQEIQLDLNFLWSAFSFQISPHLRHSTRATASGRSSFKRRNYAVKLRKLTF